MSGGEEHFTTATPARVPDLKIFNCRLVWALCVWSLSGCDVGAPARVEIPPDAAAGEVAFRMAGMGGAALVVPVYINGRGPYELVLDTGATLTCVDETLAEELALPERRGAMGIGAAVGSTGRIKLVTLDSVRVGSISLRRLTGCVLDLANLARFTPGARGLLGLNVLRNFKVTLDFQRNIVTLAKP